jgi:hypothetical protein
MVSEAFRIAVQRGADDIVFIDPHAGSGCYPGKETTVGGPFAACPYFASCQTYYQD